MLTVRTGIRIWTALSLVTLATGCTTISDAWEGSLFSSDEPTEKTKPAALYETEKPFERAAPVKEAKPAPVVRKKTPGKKEVRLPSFMPPWGALTPVGTYAAELTVSFSEEARRTGAPESIPTLLLYSNVSDGSVQMSANALGMNVWSMRVDGNMIFEERGEKLPEFVDGTRVLRDWTLASWPAASLQSRLTSGWRMKETHGAEAVAALDAEVDSGLQTLRSAKDLRHVDLTHDGESLYRLWTGSVEAGHSITYIVNDREAYRLTIESKRQ